MVSPHPSCDLVIIYSMPDSMLSFFVFRVLRRTNEITSKALSLGSGTNTCNTCVLLLPHASSQSILKVAQRGKLYSYLHFRDDETEA